MAIEVYQAVMRTTIDIDPELLAQAMAVTGLKTKKAAIEEALRRMIQQHRQHQAIANLAGLGWEGDLDLMRRS